ncbi:MAG: flagellar assembly protein FliW [Nitrospirae bacterium]|nr:flagellar assembly protein FliW [Nitrospirota bacterium]
MIIKTSRFGTLEVEDAKVVTFPLGLYGFPGEKRYVLLDHDRETPFRWLQSVENPDLAFVVIDPLTFRPDYHVSVQREDISEVQPENEKDLAVLALVTIPRGNPSTMTANLQGPLVINVEKMLGKQVVLLESEFHTAHRIIEEMKVLGEQLKTNEKAQEKSPPVVVGRNQAEMGLITLQAAGM